MPIIAWSDKYSVGMQIIDTQHKKLFELINQLYEAMTQGKSKDVLGKILKELIDYAAYHFKTEEDLFRKYSYGDKVNHVKTHEDLKQKVLDFNNKFNSGQTNISIEILNFLKDWIDKHILLIDKKYMGKLS